MLKEERNHTARQDMIMILKQKIYNNAPKKHSNIQKIQEINITIGKLGPHKTLCGTADKLNNSLTIQAKYV